MLGAPLVLVQMEDAPRRASRVVGPVVLLERRVPCLQDVFTAGWVVMLPPLPPVTLDDALTRCPLGFAGTALATWRWAARSCSASSSSKRPKLWP
jgi:hypothetical protein